MSELKVGIKEWAPHAPLVYAQQQGWVDNIDFELSEDEDAKEQDFREGRLHVLGTTLDYVPFLAAHTPTVKVFLKLGESAGADAIVARSGIASAKQLKGRTVAYEPPGVSELLLIEFLRGAGLDLSDLTVKEVGHDETPAALSTGEADAIVTWEPYVQEALEALPGSAAIFSSKQTPGLIAEVLVTTDAVLATHADLLASIARSQFRAVANLRATSDPAQLLADAMQADVDEMRQMMAVVSLADDAANRTAFTAVGARAPIAELAHRLADIWHKRGLTTHMTTTPIDSTVVRRALGQG